MFAHDTESEFYLDGTDTNAAKELLRLPIRAALLTWGFGYAVATQVGGAADAIENLPSSGSPAGPALGEAAAALRVASEILDREPRDYAAAFSLLRQAVDHLEAARRLAPRLVPARLMRRLVATAQRGAVDVEAFVTMTTQTSTQAEAIAEIERRIARGRALAGRRGFGAAIREYEAAAVLGSPLIDWNDRGALYGNPDQGFFGTPAR